MIKIEHIGIAVKNIVEANKLFTALLGSEPYKSETVATEKVITSFFKVGESKVELLEATEPGSPVSKFIENRGEGIHHIALEVEDIWVSMKQLREAGFTVLSEEPKKGADNKLVCFL